MLKKAAPSSSARRADPVDVPAARATVPNDLKQKILDRDQNTCQCCGFKSEKYQQILFKDFNPNNLSEDNLLTTCIFCHQCFDLTHAADMKAGTLVWLPEIPQADLNNIAKAIYIARIAKGPVSDFVRTTLDLMMERRQEAVKRITTDNPFILATVLNDYLPLKPYKQAAKKLEGIRLFPLDRRLIKEAELEFNQFPQILAYWRSKNGPFGGKNPADWIGLYQDVIANAGGK